MPLSVTVANREEADVLRRLGQMYLHEMSRFTDHELQDDGTFPFPHLEDSFQSDTKYPYIIRLKGKVAGFVLVRVRETTDDKPFFEITDLFVLETYRRFGVAEEVVRVVFERHTGLWRITACTSHDVASAFWRKVIRRYALKSVREFASPDIDATVYEFVSPPPASSPAHDSVLARPILKVSVKQTG